MASTSTHLSLHIQELINANEQILKDILHLADAAVQQAAATADGQPKPGFLDPLVNGLEYILTNIQSFFDKYNVPYSYGWSIVALTALVKLAAFPLTKKQVESTMAVQRLKPQIDKIKELYGDNKDAVQREQNAMYEKAGVDPLAGCLPSLATIPIFIGLYRSLSKVAQEGTLEGQGFYWIPSLAGPTSVAAQKAGSGTAWLFPLVDGHPPIGWELASRYLVLPVALVVAQWISSAIISPPVDPNADNAKTQKIIVALLPLMIGWFSLNVPSGLSLYYFSNTVITSATQVFLRKLGGVQLGDLDLGPIGLGKARRSGEVVDIGSNVDGAVIASSGSGGIVQGGGVGGEEEATLSNGNGMVAVDGNGISSGEDAAAEDALMASSSGGVVAVENVINRRCKRKKKELLTAKDIQV
jgi:YidC/Oxa1 family membrane protein insertase